MSLFTDRSHAGQVLGAALEKYSTRADLVVLALPRGGVAVGFEVARILRAPLDVLLVRMPCASDDPELAAGALADLSRRELKYRGPKPALDVLGKLVILVDDGLATAATLRAALAALRQREPTRIVAAVPVADADACEAMADDADHALCAVTPEPFRAVELWYEDFAPMTDQQVRELLVTAGRDRTHPGIGPGSAYGVTAHGA